MRADEGFWNGTFLYTPHQERSIPLSLIGCELVFVHHINEAFFIYLP